MTAPPRGLRTPVTFPPAERKFRGLRLTIDTEFRLHFGMGKVVYVEPVKVEWEGPHQTLPEWWDLTADIERWGAYSLSSWTTSKLNAFEWDVRIGFRTDPSLERSRVLYEVGYADEESKSGISLPSSISIEAGPGDTDAWEELIRILLEHEEKIRELRSRLNRGPAGD